MRPPLSRSGFRSAQELRTSSAAEWVVSSSAQSGGAVGGAIFALAVHLPEEEPSQEVVDWISVGSFAVSGGFLEALIGALWRPPRLGVGLASGLVAGAVIEVILNGIGWTINSDLEQALASGIRVAAIVGLAVASLLALDPQESSAKADAVPRSG